MMANDDVCFEDGKWVMGAISRGVKGTQPLHFTRYMSIISFFLAFKSSSRLLYYPSFSVLILLPSLSNVLETAG